MSPRCSPFGLGDMRLPVRYVNRTGNDIGNEGAMALTSAITSAPAHFHIDLSGVSVEMGSVVILAGAVCRFRNAGDQELSRGGGFGQWVLSFRLGEGTARC